MKDDKKQLLKWFELALVFTAGTVLLALVYVTCRQDSAYSPIMLDALHFTVYACGVAAFGFLMMAYLYFVKLAMKLILH